MTDDLISRGAVLAELNRIEKKSETIPVELARIIVERIPKIDIEKQTKIGQWVKMPIGAIQTCKTCGRIHPMPFLFCPHCGAPITDLTQDERLQTRRRKLCEEHMKHYANCDNHCPLRKLRGPGMTCTEMVWNKPTEVKAIFDEQGV